MKKTLYTAAFFFFSLLFVASSSFGQGLDSFTGSRLIGTELRTQTDDYVGQISDFVIDPSSGRIVSVILSDARGMGSEPVSIPFDAISRIGDHTFVYNTHEGVYYFYSDASRPLGLDVYSKVPMPMGDHFSEWLGANTETSEGEGIARIDDIVFDSSDGHVVYCVLTDVGGMEGKTVAVPFNTLSKMGKNIFVFNESKEKLLAAPAFRPDDMNSRSYASDIYRYYGLQPYWESE